MTVNPAVEKVDLLSVLELVANEPRLKHGEYVAIICDQFACSTRAAKDALEVLKQAGFLEHQLDPRDRRVRRYQITTRGEELLEIPAARHVLRSARSLFSTCVSAAKARKREKAHEAGQSERQLERLLDFSAVALSAPAGLPGRRLPLPTPAPVALPVRQASSIREGRCKVCRSPHRAEIDLWVAEGLTQAEVRRRVNSIPGGEQISASGLSRHVQKHINVLDDGVGEILQSRLDEDANLRQALYQQLSTIVQHGNAALRAGATVVTPRELMRAVQAQERLSATTVDKAVLSAETETELRAFVTAVQRISTESQFQQILALFERGKAEADIDAAIDKRRRLLGASNRRGC